MIGPAQVRSLVQQHWGLPVEAVEPLEGGMNSSTWLVTAAGTRHVGKAVSPAGRDDLADGCAVALRLAGHGLVTGAPVPTRAGEPMLHTPPFALVSHVRGRELDPADARDQARLAGVLAQVHRAEPVPSGSAVGFLEGLLPEPRHAPGWLVPAGATVLAEVGTPLTWGTLHTDPAPEAFLHEEASGTTALIDWAGARPGPLLYDVASAVMYLGGEEPAAAFLDAYRGLGVLGEAELAMLPVWRRARWLIQARYFSDRAARGDRTGLEEEAGNQQGLDRARRGLAALGVDVA